MKNLSTTDWGSINRKIEDDMVLCWENGYSYNHFYLTTNKLEIEEHYKGDTRVLKGVYSIKKAKIQVIENYKRKANILRDARKKKS